MKLQKINYVAEATSTGGQDGRSQTPDKLIDLKLTPPKEMGGAGDGVNPEQLFAAGYSACFLGAIKAVATREQVTVPTNSTVTAHVGIGPAEPGYGEGFGLDIDLKVNLPGLDKFVAQSLIDKAHKICPYSNATRNNVDVRLKLI